MVGATDPKTPRSNLVAWVAVPLLALPLGLPVGRFALIRWDQHRAEAAALAELARPQPLPAAYGVLGGIRLEQGRLAEAIPLLQKAAVWEASQGRDTRDSLCLAKAEIDGAAKGVPGANQAAAAQALQQAERLAVGLAQGKQAQTYFSAGLFWRQLGHRDEALRDLRTAVRLQPDDWVDLGPLEGRGKTSGLAGYYQKMLAAAEQDRAALTAGGTP
jgi:tetratricopeptide (TPR) repeat protein